jgi:hypothetical protein
MSMKKYKRIVQLVAPASPVFAVFSETGDDSPKSADDLTLVPCPTVALFETAEDKQFVVPLIVGTLELQEPEGANFLGYAESKEQAVADFIVSDSDSE